MVRLSDHRPIQIQRGHIQQKQSVKPNFAAFSTSCRLGYSQDCTLVLGQACIRPSTKSIEHGPLSFDLRVTLPKDLTGTLRRDVLEEKQSQVQNFVTSKLRPCLNFKFADQTTGISDQEKDEDVDM